MDTPNNGHEAAGCYVKAAGCYKKESYKEAVNAMTKAIQLYTSDGRFSMAAKYEKEVAEIFEENADIKNAVTHYETSANYYEAENSPSTANACLLKVAHFAASEGDYPKAIKIFEDISKTSMSNKLLSYGVKEYLFKAGLCNLCSGDLVETKKALSRYPGIDPTFASSREYKFLIAITESYENRDEESFDNAVEEFTTITPFDAWKTTILSTIQDKVKKNEDEDSDGVL